MNGNEERDEFFTPTPNGTHTPGTPDTAPMPVANQKGGAWKKRVIAVCVALAVLFTGFGIGWFSRYAALDGRLKTFLWAKDTTVRNYYTPIDEDALYDDMMAALEKQIDQYSCFYTREEFSVIMSESEGQNAGVGFGILESEADGKTLIQIGYIVDNSPAQQAGLKKGMYIFAFGTSENNLEEGTIEDLVAYRFGGTVCMRCGFRADGSDSKIYTAKASEYLAAYTRYYDSETSFAFRGEKQLALTETHEPISGLDGSTAVIRLDEFNGNAGSEFELCLKKMKERRRTNLILDLRSNGGGYMTTLTSIASHLMRNAEGRNPLVTYAKYRDGSLTHFNADGNDFNTYFSSSSRVTVLVDEGTASASECLLGALVDYGTIDYGDIYVRKNDEVSHSYGKGIMQSYFQQGAGGDVMKLTVASVHWPISGKCIHGVGVTTDDGAIAVESPYVWGEEDVFLTEVLSRVCSSGQGSPVSVSSNE